MKNHRSTTPKGNAVSSSTGSLPLPWIGLPLGAVSGNSDGLPVLSQ
jgi:hypothetical protein